VGSLVSYFIHFKSAEFGHIDGTCGMCCVRSSNYRTQLFQKQNIDICLVNM